MSIGQNRKIAYIVLTIFILSLTSVVLMLCLPSSDSFKIDILGIISHSADHNEEPNEYSYRDILHNNEDPIFVIESDGSFSYLSPGFEAKLGYELGELIGEPFFPTVGEKDLPSLMEEFTKMLTKGKSLNSVGPYRIQTKKAEFIYVLLSATVLEGINGEASKILGSMKDITDSVEKFKKDEPIENYDETGQKIRDTEDVNEKGEEERMIVDSVS